MMFPQRDIPSLPLENRTDSEVLSMFNFGWTPKHNTPQHLTLLDEIIIFRPVSAEPGDSRQRRHYLRKSLLDLGRSCRWGARLLQTC